MIERWAAISESAIHEISDHGNFRRTVKWGDMPAFGLMALGELQKPGSKTKYYQVKFRVNGVQFTKQAHRLVALAFIPNPLNLPEVNHKDGNGLNNYFDNLEWVTGATNSLHASRIIYSHAKECVAISPNGEVFHFKNLAEFSEKHGLSKTATRAVAQGNRSHHKGWQFRYVESK
jgi:hypothetical protein